MTDEELHALVYAIVEGDRIKIDDLVSEIERITDYDAGAIRRAIVGNFPVGRRFVFVHQFERTEP